MKKLLLLLGISSLISLSSTSVFAESCQDNSWAKPMSESEWLSKADDCGCQTNENSCNSCSRCHEMVERCPLSNCFEKKREELYCRLNLDTCQRNQAKNIENAYKPALDNEKDAIKAAHKCLCEKIQAACLDKSAIRSQEKVLKQEFKSLKSTMKSMDKEFKQILQREQKSEYRKIKREMKYRVKKGTKYCCKPCKCEK
ncbi:hypothetical protein IJ818_06940 [bacterium]|nr:hypothetical protein [bacterium]